MIVFVALGGNKKMTYEEKRELRLQISQLLADAGLNQCVIKEMVEEEIRNKVERAIDQVMKKLDSETSNGNYVETKLKSMFNNIYITQRAFDRVVKEELKNRIINVTLKGMETDERVAEPDKRES